MKLSVVVPIYNEEKFLGPCLTGLLHQTRKPDEIVCVIDTRTTDMSELICQDYSSRLFKSSPGKLTARDIGIKRTSCEIIVGLDADVLCPPTYLQDVERIFQDDSVIAAHGWTEQPAPQFLLEFWYKSRLSGRNSAFRQSAYESTGGFDLTIDQNSRREMVAEEEIAFLHKLRALGQVGWIKTPCQHLRSLWEHRIGMNA
jgi:glycosyltransferase involved in cell wall biosynthesis